MSRESNREVQEAAEKLPPDLALLLAAMRSEFEAKLDLRFSKMTNRLLVMGIPLGAAGGFAAEMVRPNLLNDTASFILRVLLAGF